MSADKITCKGSEKDDPSARATPDQDKPAPRDHTTDFNEPKDPPLQIFPSRSQRRLRKTSLVEVSLNPTPTSLYPFFGDHVLPLCRTLQSHGLAACKTHRENETSMITIAATIVTEHH